MLTKLFHALQYQRRFIRGPSTCFTCFIDDFQRRMPQLDFPTTTPAATPKRRAAATPRLNDTTCGFCHVDADCDYGGCAAPPSTQPTTDSTVYLGYEGFAECQLYGDSAGDAPLGTAAPKFESFDAARALIPSPVPHAGATLSEFSAFFDEPHSTLV